MATILKRGSRWRAQIRRQGQRALSKSFASKTEASAWARETESRIDRGLSIEAGRRVTLSELIFAYREQVTAIKGTSRSKAQAIEKIEKLLGTRRLVELKTNVFVEFCKKRETEGAGPATILQDFSYIGTVLRHGGALTGAEQAATAAIAALDAARRTLRHAGRIAKAEERNRRPSDEELNQLIQYWAANPRQHIPMIDLMLFAIATAMRIGEVLNLKWEDLDETNRTIVIRARKHPTKKATNHQRVPLLCGPFVLNGSPVDPLQIMLRQPTKWHRQGRIFPHAAQSTSMAFQRATAELGIEDLHFHDLRHDGASRLFEAGYPIERVALITGHRDWNMLRRYTQLRAEDFHEGRKLANSDNVIAFETQRSTL